MSTQVTPRRQSSDARSNPVGPAPTTRTATSAGMWTVVVSPAARKCKDRARQRRRGPSHSHLLKCASEASQAGRCRLVGAGDLRLGGYPPQLVGLILPVTSDSLADPLPTTTDWGHES